MAVERGAKIYADIRDTDNVTLYSAFSTDDLEARYPIAAEDVVETSYPGDLEPDERYTYNAGTDTVEITADPDWVAEVTVQERLDALELAVF